MINGGHCEPTRCHLEPTYRPNAFQDKQHTVQIILLILELAQFFQSILKLPELAFFYLGPPRNCFSLCWPSHILFQLTLDFAEFVSP